MKVPVCRVSWSGCAVRAGTLACALALPAWLACLPGPALAGDTAPAATTQPARLQLRLAGTDPASPGSGAVLVDDLPLQDARAEADAKTGQVSLLLRLAPSGARRLAEVTRARIGQRLAFVAVEAHRTLLLSAPRVAGEIDDGQLLVSLHMPLSEARDLARNLRAARRAPETGLASDAARPGTPRGRPGSP